MKPVIGPASEIIPQALSLCILCRPVGHSCRLGLGEALELTRDTFWHHSAEEGWPVTQYAVSPHELTLDWELITKDLVAAEYRKACENPF